MSMDRSDLTRLLELIRITNVREIDCGEFLQQVGAFLEQLGPDRDPPPGFDDVVHHLRICPECVEEFEALYRALRSESSESG